MCTSVCVCLCVCKRGVVHWVNPRTTRTKVTLMCVRNNNRLELPTVCD